jgi:hypothetical protein
MKSIAGHIRLIIRSNKEEVHLVIHACLCSWGSWEKKGIHIPVINPAYRANISQNVVVLVNAQTW